MEPISEEQHSPKESERVGVAPVLLRKASLSEAERVFLHAILLDKDFHRKVSEETTFKELSDDILFSIPPPLIAEPPFARDVNQQIAETAPLISIKPQCDLTANDIICENQDSKKEATESTPLIPTKRRNSKYHTRLWRSYEEGVKPSVLRNLAKRKLSQQQEQQLREREEHDKHIGEIEDASKDVNLKQDMVASTCMAGDTIFADKGTYPPQSTEPREEDDELIGEIVDTSKDVNLKRDMVASTCMAGDTIVADKGTSPPQSTEPDNEDEVQDSPEENFHEDYDSTKAIAELIDESDTVPSDEEVRADDDDDKSKASSWDESEGGFEHYDAWQVLNDEYAKEAGFSYADEETGDYKKSIDTEGEGFFKILATSADDISAQPHVMSPPLMESLLSFVPEHLAQQNLWLKFSLVRDGEYYAPKGDRLLPSWQPAKNLLTRHYS